VSVVLKITGLANGGETPASGQYVRAYDPDANGGLGHVGITPDVRQAMRFASTELAIEKWRQTSSVKPDRDDGQPNQPLMAFRIVMETVKP
jgi:hypothetical protein